MPSAVMNTPLAAAAESAAPRDVAGDRNAVHQHAPSASDCVATLSAHHLSALTRAATDSSSPAAPKCSRTRRRSVQ